jgi:penicillin-binding protein 1A
MTLRRVLIGLGIVVGVGVISVIAFLIAVLQGLPSLQDLEHYQPPVTSRVHAGDGALVAEFATQQRVFVPSNQIPDRVKQAFIATEDARFFEHSGIDYQGLARALLTDVGNALRGRRFEGASTITQQVAGNMLTGREAHGIAGIIRKIREGVLAQRIEKVMGKEHILELYLNQIYLGNQAYGVGAAALNYYDKSLDDLTLSEAAFLGALPKGPGNYDPVRNHQRAVERRNLVLSRMQERGYITQAEMRAAQAEPLITHDRLSGDQYVAATPFVEEVRRQVQAEYGDQALLEGGLSIRSTLDTHLQLAAAQALRAGLERYDRRHSWRGPIKVVAPGGNIQADLRTAAAAPTLSGWTRAMVTGTQGGVRVTDETGASGLLIADDANWAAQAAHGRNNANRALVPGAIIYVQRQASGGRFGLKQVPNLQGALVAMDPHTGRVLAMVGGYFFEANHGLNRATQAFRQPGSSIKPIVYAAALDTPINIDGNPTYITPATLIDDAPFSVAAGDGSMWSPENYEHDFLGPTPLRRGLELSRNAMTARVAYQIGPDRVLDYGKRLGVYGDNTQAVFALALGSGETTLLRMTTAYGMFVNGGKRIQPIIIDRIQDRNGRTIFARDQRQCQGCNDEWHGQAPPDLPDARQQVLDPVTAYQIVSMAQGVVDRGTGTVIHQGALADYPLAGKTGTTTDYKDNWFVGFSPDLVVGVWVGFDQPVSLGEGETGAQNAAPIFRDFMQVALHDVPAAPFRIPSGVRLVRIDRLTGLLPGPSTTDTILEAFRPGTEPTTTQQSSPFVFGGTQPIDPRVVSDLQNAFGPGAQAQAAQTAAAQSQAAAHNPAPNSQQQQQQELGGLY